MASLTLKRQLFSFLKEKRKDSRAIDWLVNTIAANDQLEPSDERQARRIKEQQDLLSYALQYIREHPGKWYEPLSRELNPSSARKNFDGHTVYITGSQEYREDSKGEKMVVSSDKNQQRDTAWLLKKLGEGDIAGIEKGGYKVRRANRQVPNPKP